MRRRAVRLGVSFGVRRGATLVVLFAEVATRGEPTPYRGSNTRFSATLWT